MKPKHVIQGTVICLASIVLTFIVTQNALLGRSIVKMPDFKNQDNKTVVAANNCTTSPKRVGLETSIEPHIKKLAEYENWCGSALTDTLMIFTDMPNSEENAKVRAANMALTLKEFRRFNLKPLVVIEPTSDWGFVDFKEFRNGFYDKWIKAYFEELKRLGITESEIGTWLPFPEANLPYWNHQNSTPDDFSANVNKFVSILRASFPTSKATILLNSATYETDDFDWRNGDYQSLLPYVKGITPGTLNSFGLQGLPWIPPADQLGGGVVDPNEFLNHKLADEAAKALGVKYIWFNTGTFSRKFTLEENKTATMPSSQRKDILFGTVTQANRLQQLGYNVSINLFAEDKSKTQEATDWSYWSADRPGFGDDATVLNEFVRKLNESKVELWLFDISK